MVAGALSRGRCRSGGPGGRSGRGSDGARSGGRVRAVGVAIGGGSHGGGARAGRHRQPRGDRPAADPLAQRALPALIAAQNLWFYGIFASYRDAHRLRGDEGRRYPVSHEELGQLVSAPVRPRVLRRPWFWAGLPLALGAAVGYSLLSSPQDLG